MLKRWNLNLNLTTGSASLTLRISAETLIPSAPVDSRRLFNLRRLLPWIRFKSPTASPPPFPPPKLPRKRKSLSSKFGFLRSLRKIRLFRRRTIQLVASSPTDDEYELPRRLFSPRSRSSRKAAAAVASLWALVVAWILSERLRQWCGAGALPGQWSCLSSLIEPICYII